MNINYIFLCSIFLIFNALHSVTAQQTKLDSLRTELSGWQLSDPLSPKDTVWIIESGNLCLLYYNHFELDSLRDLSIRVIDKLEKMQGSQSFKAISKRLDYFFMQFYSYKGMAYNQLSDYANGLKAFQQYLIYAEKVGSIKDIANGNSYIAYCHKDMKDYKLAHVYALKAQSILKNTKYKSALANTYTVIADYYYYHVESLDSAIFHMKYANKLYEETGNVPLYTNTIQDLIFYFLSDYKIADAKKYLQLADSFCREQENPAVLGRHLFQKGEVAYLDGNNEKALQYLAESEKTLGEDIQPIMIVEINRVRAVAYAAMGRTIEASTAAHLSIEKYGIDLNNEKARALTTTELNFEFERKKVQAEIALQRQKRFRDIALVGLGLGLIAAFLMYRLYALSRKSAKNLLEKNTEIERSYNELKSTQSQLLSTEKQREALSVRVNIARDIHDELGAGLTKITLLSDLALRKINTNQSEIKDILHRVIINSKSVSNALSEIVWAVNPAYDTAEGLTNYLRQYCHHFLMDTGIDYSLVFPDSTPDVPVTPEVKRNIFLVLKEALNNTVKYAKANNIGITFSLDKSHYAMTIKDNGIGFTLDNTTEYGNGILNMQHRMENIGGNLTIHSSLGNGCSIEVTGIISNT